VGLDGEVQAGTCLDVGDVNRVLIGVTGDGCTCDLYRSVPEDVGYARTVHSDVSFRRWCFKAGYNDDVGELGCSLEVVDGVGVVSDGVAGDACGDAYT